ncbi:MAG TPA: hypothetical protein VGL97_10375 [Bryobacteraceae bacterium]|jgi:hypothetical protein
MASNPLPAELRSAVEECLEGVLRSDAFCNSRQSEKLLRYLVEHSLDGRDHLLREKQVGVAVFSREEGYDTSVDPIVRVRVNEIRKRLAVYYKSPATPEELRFEIPSGSYRVKFVRPEVSAALEPPPAAGKVSRIHPFAYLALALIAAAAALAGGLVWSHSSKNGPLQKFWKPALTSSAPVILCSGHPVLYRFSTAFWSRINLGALDQFQFQTTTPKIPPGTLMHPSDIVPISNQYIGLGSAYTIARISSWLADNHKESEIRFGNDISFSDLKRSPAVLIGAFQNRWTLQMMAGQRFTFETIGTTPGVRDRKTGKTWTLPHLKEDGSTDEDYIIITRVLHSDSGQFIVVAAGITQYGCHAAADVLTSSDFLGKVLAQLPPDWPTKTVEILVHVPVIGEIPGNPSLVAAQAW